MSGRPPRFQRRLVAFLAFSALLMGAAPAEARRGRRGRGLSAGSRPQGPVLTQQELEWCVRNERIIDNEQAALDARDRRMTEGRRAIEQADASLSQRAARLDRRSQAEVNAYNAAVREHQSRIAAFNAEVASRNSQMEALNARISDYNIRCSGKNYFESDLRAVLERIGS